MTNGNYNARFPAWLRLRMCEMNIAGRDLAAALDISHVAVSHWRTGKFTPRPHHVVKLAKVLRVTENTIKGKLGA